VTQVAILGCGPAALFAAEAVEQAGHEPVIMALKLKSKLFGAQYLHEPIPGVPARSFPLEVLKVGTGEGYAYKVYGDRKARVSWSKYKDGVLDAWSLHDAYNYLWDKYEPRIQHTVLNPNDIGPIANNYPLTLCSIPVVRICGNPEHEFTSQRIYVVHHDSDPFAPSQLIYNGDGSRAEWYRFSRINGTSAWEYAVIESPEMLRIPPQSGFKPVSTTCNCWLSYPGFHRIGRYGRWSKGVLTHHAYNEAKWFCEKYAL
jgi:hypothetical protein